MSASANDVHPAWSLASKSRKPQAMRTLNIRQERFAREYIKRNGNAAQAYRAAGYAPTTRNALDAGASRLLSSDKVSRRIEGLLNAMNKRHNVTLDSLADELDEARGLALRIDQPGAAVTATTVKAKLFGHLVDRKEVGKPGDFGEETDAQAVLERVRKELGDDAATALAAAIGPETAPDEQPAPDPTHEAPDQLN